jgi:hypothetical protein
MLTIAVEHLGLSAYSQQLYYMVFKTTGKIGVSTWAHSGHHSEWTNTFSMSLAQTHPNMQGILLLLNNIHRE